MATKTKVTKKPEVKEIKLSEMTASELVGLSRDLKVRIAKAKLEVAARRAKNTREGFLARKKLARVMTILNVKKIV
jgi:ribosomal protein L29